MRRFPSLASGLLVAACCARLLAAAEDIGQLRMQLAAEQPEQRAAAAKQLAKRGKAAAPAVGDLARLTAEDPEPLVRAAASAALGELGLLPEKSIPALIAACGDTAGVTADQQVYQIAGSALRKFGKQSLPRLRRLLASDDDQQRMQAGYAVDHLGPLAAGLTDDLIPLLSSDNARVRITGINGLLKIGEPAKSAIPQLMPLLEHEDFHTRYWTCRALAAMGEHSLPAVDKLLELLADDVTSVRRNAAAALGEIGVKGGPRVVEGLIAALEPGRYSVQEQAVIALGKLAPLSKPAQAPLEKLLESPGFSVRAETARTLWLISPGNSTSPAVLLRELKSINAPYEAVPAIGALGAEMKILPQVAAALGSEIALVRQCAADALGLAGAAAAPHRAALEKVRQNDPDEEVRVAADEALRRIAEAAQK